MWSDWDSKDSQALMILKYTMLPRSCILVRKPIENQPVGVHGSTTTCIKARIPWGHTSGTENVIYRTNNKSCRSDGRLRWILWPLLILSLSRFFSESQKFSKSGTNRKMFPSYWIKTGRGGNGLHFYPIFLHVREKNNDYKQKGGILFAIKRIEKFGLST